jgi:hypothetical protein
MSTIKFEVVHTFDGPATALLEKIAAGLGAPAQVVNVTPKPRRKRRTAVEIAADDAASKTAPDAPKEEDAAPEPKAAAKPTGPSIDDVRSKVRAFHKANGTDAVKALFDGLSGASIQTIKDPADLQTLSNRLDALAAVAPPSTAGSFD